MDRTPLGYHTVLDLWRCHRNLETTEGIKEKIEKIVSQNGLTVLDSTFKKFSNNSWSVLILLEESHVSCHTWPERGYVSADVFVCNYSKDNYVPAQKVSESLIDFFGAIVYEKQVIRRHSGPSSSTIYSTNG